LFNPGPVNVDETVRTNLFNMEISHRQPEFEALEASVRTRLHRQLGFSNPPFELSLMHGSGTLAVDAALATFVRGSVVVVHNGLYCERIASTLRQVGANAVELRSAFGEPPRLVELENLVRTTRPSWVALVHHETTTGLLNPLAEIVEISRRHGARVFVDAVSSIGAHPVDAEVDVVCFNSSKCLEGLPGIGAIFWRAGLQGHPTLSVLDAVAHARALPSTPNVQAFVALDIALDLLGKEDRPARYARLARHVWAAGSAHFEPLLPEAHRSHVLTSFKLDGRDPDAFFRRAWTEGLIIYHGQKQLRSEIFRVANMGAAMNEEIISRLFAVLARPR
jgi:2-aminoethylphosphonate-pyruvate transaminase